MSPTSDPNASNPEEQPTSATPDPNASNVGEQPSPSPAKEQPAPPEAPDCNNLPEKRIHYGRMLVFFALVILIYFFGNNVVYNANYGLFLTIISVVFFDPIYEIVDKLDIIICRMRNQRKTPLSQSNVKANPRLGGLFRTFQIIVLLALIWVQLSYSIVGPWAYNLWNNKMCPWTFNRAPFCNSGIGVTVLSNGVHIGLIMKEGDGGPFDQTASNSNEQYIESRIFSENKTACSEPQRITLAVVTILSRTSEDPTYSASAGLDNLQGAYIAQKDYNATSPQHNLCLVIANLGTLKTSKPNASSYALPSVISQLLMYKRYDDTFHGIIGFPYSSQAYEATQDEGLKRTSIPIVSPSATSNSLSMVRNFYRVSSPDSVQALVMAQFFCNNFVKQKTIYIDVFSAPDDKYSKSLSDRFDSDIQQKPCLSYLHIDHDSYANGNKQSIKEAVQNALNKTDSFIFFPGYATDLTELEGDIERSQQNTPVPSRMTIFGGDGLYDITDPNGITFATVYSSIYASPLGSSSIDQAFIKEFQDSNFSLPYLAGAAQGYTLLPQGVIRSYNATMAFTSTFHSLEINQRDITQDNINQVLSQIQFNGLGENHFVFGDAANQGNNSDPNPIPVYIMCTDRIHGISLAARYDNGSFTPDKPKSCS